MSPFVCRGFKIILKGSCCLPCSIILTHSPRAILSLRSSNSLIEACIDAPSITGGNSKASEIDIENAKNIWKGRELRMKLQDICYVLDMGSPAPPKRTGIFYVCLLGLGSYPAIIRSYFWLNYFWWCSKNHKGCWGSGVKPGLAVCKANFPPVVLSRNPQMSCFKRQAGIRSFRISTIYACV